jgi:HEAT repeat protein
MFMMKSNSIDPSDIRTMIADYMEKGFLENIIDMYKYDSSLYTHIGELMKDERLIVRIGISALLDTLKTEDFKNISKAIPSILPLLKDKNPVLRSDAAYFLGMIGNKDVIHFLRDVIDDEDENVRVIAKEAIEDIEAAS